MGALEDANSDLLAVIKADPRNGGAKKELKVSLCVWVLRHWLRGNVLGKSRTMPGFVGDKYVPNAMVLYGLSRRAVVIPPSLVFPPRPTCCWRDCVV